RTRRLMRILGVDPGLTRCGIGVIDTLPARKVKMTAVDVLRTPSADSIDLRLGAIAEAFDTWWDTHRPDMVAIERVFARNDVSTIMRSEERRVGKEDRARRAEEDLERREET